ncbi:hypothetical protein LINGRAHAP2_LOCUS26004 [Linum grandiflorum]
MRHPTGTWSVLVVDYHRLHRSPLLFSFCYLLRFLLGLFWITSCFSLHDFETVLWFCWIFFYLAMLGEYGSELIPWLVGSRN